MPIGPVACSGAMRRLVTFLVTGQLAGLAGGIGVDPHGLERSVERDNRIATSSIDEDFDKESSAYNLYKR